MDYKEKYEMALERARVWKEKSGMPADKQGILDDIFPELAESEDEQIRKWLIGYFHQYKEDGMEKYANGLKVESIIAWLEKQGEQKPFDYENANIQQKDFAPKVEPKFKVGDYIERKDGLGCHVKIIFVGKNVYGCEKLIYPKDSSPFFELMFENQDEFKISSDFQQKLAWSEEDEKMLKSIIGTCELVGQDRDSSPAARHLVEIQTNWLKTLKERCTWKPSDEQMADLWNMLCECRPADHQLLQDIYYGLKKLR